MRWTRDDATVHGEWHGVMVGILVALGFVHQNWWVLGAAFAVWVLGYSVMHSWSVQADRVERWAAADREGPDAES